MHKLSFEGKFLYLPSDNDGMEKFLDDNRTALYYYVIDKIDDVLSTGEDFVEVFGFKGTQYYVILYKDNFLATLDSYFSYFMENEMYEGCGKVKMTRDKLEKYIKLVKTT
jgi:hypothetical protein